jgi:GTP-binding protein
LLNSALIAYRDAGADLPTPRLNKILQDALMQNAAPMSHGRAIRLRYAHQGGRYPPLVVIHGNQVDRLPASYRRYLENSFRQALKLKGTPVKIEFRVGENPYAGRRNVLTPRQIKSKRRVIRHRKKDG